MAASTAARARPSISLASRTRENSFSEGRGRHVNKIEKFELLSTIKHFGGLHRPTALPTVSEYGPTAAARHRHELQRTDQTFLIKPSFISIAQDEHSALCFSACSRACRCSCSTRHVCVCAIFSRKRGRQISGWKALRH